MLWCTTANAELYCALGFAHITLPNRAGYLLPCLWALRDADACDVKPLRDGAMWPRRRQGSRAAVF